MLVAQVAQYCSFVQHRRRMIAEFRARTAEFRTTSSAGAVLRSVHAHDTPAGSPPDGVWREVEAVYALGDQRYLPVDALVAQGAVVGLRATE